MSANRVLGAVRDVRLRRIEPDAYPVALYTPTLAAGGAERMFVALANGFADCGYPVHLLVLTGGGPLKAVVSPSVDLVELNTGFATALPRISHLLRSWHVSGFLVSHDHRCLFPCLAAYLARVPFVPTIHQLIGPGFSWSDDAGVLQRGALYALAWSMFRAARAVVAVSAAAARGTEANLRLRSDSVRVLPQPAIPRGLTQMAAEAVPHPWFITKDHPIIATAARLTDDKDIGTLVRAFAIVRRIRPARLVVIGDGDARQAIADVASAAGVGDDVLLPGFDPNPWRWMSRADVVAVSSRSEGLSCVLIEALALGIPVVSTDCGGPREILDGGRWGQLVPVGRADTLARALLTALDSHTDGEAARRAVQERYSVEAAVRSYGRLFLRS